MRKLIVEAEVSIDGAMGGEKLEFWQLKLLPRSRWRLAMAGPPAHSTALSDRAPAMCLWMEPRWDSASEG